MKKFRKVLAVVLAAVFSLSGVFAGNTTVFANNAPTKGLVAYYRFDGDCKDSSGLKNDSDPEGEVTFTDGKFGKAAKFDGNSYLITRYNDSLDTLNAHTVSVWVYTDTARGDIFNDTEIDIALFNTIHVGYSADGTFYNMISKKTLDLGKWSLITETWDGTNERIYINGELDNTKESKGTRVQHKGSLTMGGAVTGLLDDLRLYNYALSDNEIKELYNGEPSDNNTANNSNTNTTTNSSTGTTTSTTTTSGSQTNAANTDASLIAHYKFDGDVKDYSGKGNDGTEVGSITYTNGIIGKGAKFDGSSYIEVADNDMLDLTDSKYTMSAWVYKEDVRPKLEQPILNKLGSSIDDTRSGYAFSDRDNVPYVTTWDTDNNYIDVISNNKLDIQKWTLLTVTNDGSSVKYYYDGVLKSSNAQKCVTPSSSGSLQIGFNNVDQSNFFTGVMDDLRIYNRALKPQEVKALFDEAKGAANKEKAMVAYYKFDEDLKDASGNKNDGSEIGNINFENGILGKCAKFNGESYIEVNDSDLLDLSSGFTFSTWINKEDISPKTEQPILCKQGSSKYEDIPSYTFSDRDNAPYVSMFDENNNEVLSNSIESLDINKWTLVTATFDGKSIKFYYNGNLISSEDETYNVPNSSGKLLVGFNNANGSCFFKGKMDDLRIYNYALSANEIKALYDSYPISKDASTSGASDWAVPEIQNAIKLNLTTDKILSDYQAKITREEFCELAVKLYEAMSGKTANPVSVNPFIDTNNPEILKAYNLGIVDGVSENEFAPGNPVTRQEISVMLLRAIKAAQPNINTDPSGAAHFEDEEQIADWAMDAVKFFNKNGILKGDGEEKISIMPKGNTTREQAIALVGRTMDKFGKAVSKSTDIENQTNTQTNDSNSNSAKASANGIDGLIEYFNSNGLTVESKTDFSASINTPIYSGYIEVIIDGSPLEVFEYDLSNKTTAKLFEDGKSSGQYPICWMGENISKIDGVSNGNLMIARFEEHPDKDKILKIFASYKH